ncbi:hypothetical protein NP233_g3037 [Leucocoprinus birnbaumii]|uniref:Cellobiose dehydrogenase-like cytochrome domain-containing protein n=1 Tax=Leucocoprinus birnbaumii TaxID=56174 RepID=A0AAD5YUB5_9AGAR|nr:hypothetical protein NP233_g3037 [Leucocoprinus birnbaumii]
MLLSSFLQVGLSLLLWLQFLPSVLALKGDSGCSPFICVNVTLHDDDWITYEVASVYEPLGWLALGFGRRMDHSQMVIMWPDEDGEIVRSQRFGWGHEEPSNLMNPSRHAYPQEPLATSWSPAPNSIRMAFNMTANRTALEVDPIEDLIWAYSMTRPEGKSPRASLTGHYRAGRIRVDYSKDAVLPPPPGGQPTSSGNMDNHHHHETEQHTNTDAVEGNDSDGGFFSDDNVPWGTHEKLIVTHGIMLAFAFLVLLPAGSLIARWSRTLTPKWFKAHSIVNMTFALPIIFIGWCFGLWAVLSNDKPKYFTAHKVWLGRYIHRRRAQGLVPGNKPHPPSNIMHVCTGILVITLAFFQVRSGFDEWESATSRSPLHAWCHDLWLAWAVIVPFAYLAGLSLIPRQFYQERQHIMPGGDINYVVLPDSADSPLLNGEEGQDGEVYEISGGAFRNTRMSMDTVKIEAAAAEK